MGWVTYNFAPLAFRNEHGSMIGMPKGPAHKTGFSRGLTHSGILNKDLTNLSYFIENWNLVRRSEAPFVRSAEMARTHPGRAPLKMRELHIFSVKTGMQPSG
jgi:hypothetical protein